MQCVEHRLDPVVVGMQQRIVQDHRDRVAGRGEKPCEGQTGQNRQNLLSTVGELSVFAEVF